MDKKQTMIIGIVCLVVCAICIFVAIERHSANANGVRFMNNLQRSTPLGDMGMRMKPAMPATTKYALFFAVLSGAAGAFLLFKSKQQEIPESPA